MSVRRYDLVLLDALGTVLDLEPPWPHLVDALAARGAPVAQADAHRAMVAEMTYYRAHCDAARDRPALEDLRDRCAAIVAAELGTAVEGLAADAIRAAMLESLRFPPYPEVPAVLGQLRDAGVQFVVVSNWDISLHDVLAATGLDAYLLGALTSAETGAAKPDPHMLHAARALAGDPPRERVLMVGDTEPDAQAARAAGVDAVLVDRHASIGAHATATVVGDLGALPGLVLASPGYPSRDE